MKILHVFNEINFSGAEIMYADAAHIFNRHGIDLYAMSTGEHFGNFVNQFTKSGIKTIHLPIPKGTLSYSRYKYFLKLTDYIKKEHFDVIHIHRAPQFFFFALCAWYSNVKSIRTVHNVFKSKPYTWVKGYFERLISRKILNLTFHTIGNSVYNNEHIYYKNSSILINNWFNIDKFYPASPAEKIELRRKLGIKDDAFVIVSSGRCTEIKNHKDIILALPHVNKNVNLLYIHLGKGVTECKEQKLAKDLGLSHKIKFEGNIENVRDYLTASDLFIMPSKFEGMSIAAIEAMACGLPSILYNSPGLVDLIQDNDNGYLIEHSPFDMAEKISLLANDLNKMKDMGLNACNYAARNFNISTSVSKLVNLYRQ